MTQLKKIVEDSFSECCGAGVSPFKYLRFEGIVGDIHRYGTLSVLGAAPLYQYKELIKTSYSRISRCIKSRMEELVKCLLSCG